MRCQKNKMCKKQPGNAPIYPKGAKMCTGCDVTGKDKKTRGKAVKNEATFDLVGMTEAQVQTVADALEFFSRVGCGQFDFIPSQLRMFDLIKHHDSEHGGEIDWGDVEDLCNRMKKCVGLVPNSHYGIYHPKVHEVFKSSYDIYKIILHNLMKRRDPERKHYNVHTDPPLFSSQDKKRPDLKCSQKAE